MDLLLLQILFYNHPMSIKYCFITISCLSAMLGQVIMCMPVSLGLHLGGRGDLGYLEQHGASEDRYLGHTVSGSEQIVRDKEQLDQ